MTDRAALTRTADARYLNREISWLDFNSRVLELAADPQVPLLERLKFCAIYASNLDEFYMVRVAGLLDHAEAGTVPSDGQTAGPTLARIAEIVEANERILEQLVVREILPALEAEGIRIVSPEHLDATQKAGLAVTFAERIFPVLTPLAVGPGTTFPYISNLSLSLGVFVEDSVTGERRFARVKVPEVLPRFLMVAETTFVALEHIIAQHLGALFPGMRLAEAAAFRVTRDAELEISGSPFDLVEAVEQELSRRRFGQVVRLEVSDEMSAEMEATIVAGLAVSSDRVFRVQPPLDLADLMPIAMTDRPGLRDVPWTPRTPPRLATDSDDMPPDVFAAIRAGDLLVHHPYDAFSSSVERFVEQAVDDPDVLAIKHTIYRTSGDSPIVPALARAAEQGKQAVAMVEVTARFDEQKNIRWARTLERAGVHVVHGVGGLKTHAKLALVVRREGGVTRRYAHIGTGNYNPSTARLYTDLGLFTCRDDIAADVADLFNLLTGFARPRRFRRLLVAPFDLRERLLEEINGCAEEHRDDQPSRIIIKANALVDPVVIDALYEASQAGVDIDLIIRGICCLRPGVPGQSEQIRVVSVLGRFLEHHRICRFVRGEETFTVMGSADIMPRNLDNRIEVMTPIDDPVLSREVGLLLETMLADTSGSWTLDADGAWHRRRPEPGTEAFSAQAAFMLQTVAQADAEARADRREAAAERLVRRARE